jgi:NCAIR mutase (PurE)-related protein
VAEECAQTLEWAGIAVRRFPDIGVANLDRLLGVEAELRRASVCIVVAGMEGALPSVVAGRIAAPVVAVPTSVGYGANFSGLSALLGMLTSCVPGVTVVNVDNGFGAAAAANRMLRTLVVDAPAERRP